jgi:hypothetical protein
MKVHQIPPHDPKVLIFDFRDSTPEEMNGAIDAMNCNWSIHAVINGFEMKKIYFADLCMIIRPDGKARIFQNRWGYADPTPEENCLKTIGAEAQRSAIAPPPAKPAPSNRTMCEFTQREVENS